MQNSDNFDAELLLKELGAVQGRGSTAAGLAVVRRYAARRGVNLTAAADGSGLSSANRVGSRALVAWLTAMAHSSAAGAFRSGLPVACRAGTLRHRLCGTPAAGRVTAKTGSLADVVALAGYGTTASGRQVRFAVLLSGVRSAAAARAAADRVVLAFTAYAG
jgi:D-alanyl-D-alanine carboxypeptidase/D-alanyl-D-alanine-endopeptidase (penicillin-binding protein 4)